MRKRWVGFTRWRRASEGEPEFRYHNGQLYKKVPHYFWRVRLVPLGYCLDGEPQFQRTHEHTSEPYYERVVERSSYRRRPHHEKKEVSVEEQNHRLWRQEKHRNRDQRRFRFRGPGRGVKKRCHQLTRAHVKRCLALGRPEDIDKEFGWKKYGYWD